jgi:hypothetical protein
VEDDGRSLAVSGPHHEQNKTVGKQDQNPFGDFPALMEDDPEIFPLRRQGNRTDETGKYEPALDNDVDKKRNCGQPRKPSF